MKRERIGVALLSGLCVLVLTTGVRADQEDDKKKAEREWREAEEGQGKKAEGQQGPGGVPGLEDNPLDKILELMRGVEDRLFESDTGDFTQEEQRKVVEAMRFEDKTSQALEELIRKIEEQMQNQQSSSGGGGSDQQQQQKQQQQSQQNPNETEEQRRQRQEREKREEEQRRMQQQNQPQQQQQSQNQPQNDREQRAEQERREGRRPEDPQRDDPRDPAAAGRWGQLPVKLHQDAQNAQNQEPPARWSELIKRYRARVAEGGSD